LIKKNGCVSGQIKVKSLKKRRIGVFSNGMLGFWKNGVLKHLAQTNMIGNMEAKRKLK